LYSTETYLPCAVAYGDYSGTANWPDKNSRVISRDVFEFFRGIARIFAYYTIFFHGTRSSGLRNSGWQTLLDDRLPAGQ
jgi:hypothetical protein